MFYVTNLENKYLFIVLQYKRQPIGDDSDLGFNLDEIPPFTTDRPITITEFEKEDNEYTVRDDHCEGI